MIKFTIAIFAIYLAACSSNMRVHNADIYKNTVNEVQQFEVFKTTISEVQNKLGLPSSVIEKDDGSVLWIYDSELVKDYYQVVIPTSIVPTRNNSVMVSGYVSNVGREKLVEPGSIILIFKDSILNEMVISDEK